MIKRKWINPAPYIIKHKLIFPWSGNVLKSCEFVIFLGLGVLSSFKNPNKNKLMLKETIPVEIYKIINDLDGKKSSDIYNIAPDLVKLKDPWSSIYLWERGAFHLAVIYQSSLSILNDVKWTEHNTLSVNWKTLYTHSSSGASDVIIVIASFPFRYVWQSTHQITEKYQHGFSEPWLAEIWLRLSKECLAIVGRSMSELWLKSSITMHV